MGKIHKPASILVTLVSLFLLAPATASAQQYPVLRRQFFAGYDGDDIPHRLLAGPDSTLLVAGSVQDKHGCTDGWVARLSLKGDLLWSKTIGGTGCDEVRDIALSLDGKSIYYAGTQGGDLGHAEGNDTPFAADVMAGQLTIDGSVLWQRTYGGTLQDMGTAIAPTKAGGCIITASTWSRDGLLEGDTPKMTNEWILITDNTGRPVRSKVYGGNKNDWGQALAASTLDDGYMVAGYTNSEELDGSQSKNNGDVWLQKLDLAGSVVWSKVLKMPYEDAVYRIVENRYGLVAAVGSTFDPNKNKDFWFMKLDQEGRELLNKVWGWPGLDELTGITQLKDGGYLLTGYSAFLPQTLPEFKGKEDCWVFRLDSDGRMIWKSTYGGPQDERGVDACEVAPGVFYVLAEKKNTFEEDRPKRGKDFWLMRIEERNCAGLDPRFTTDLAGKPEKIGIPVRFLNKTPMGERWYWDFGDGTSSDKHSPVKSYTAPGIYTATLTVFVGDNCTKTYVYPDPIIIQEP